MTAAAPAPKAAARKVAPSRASRRAAAARRLYDAQASRRAAETEWSQALAAAVDADVIPDHATEPEPVGTVRVVYVDTVVQVSLTVLAPIAGIDHAGFVAGLVRAGVKRALIARLAKRHATETRPAHRFTCSLAGVH